MALFPFWIFPLISALTWLGMLLAMLITWEVERSPHYASFNTGQRIAYISDIGAQGLKPLFIAGCCVTTVFLDLSFASERYLRHTGRLARNTTKAEKVLSAFAIIFAIAGTAGLILLSIFDTLHHPHLHDGFLLLFIAGYVISAIFICAEYQRLGVHFRQHRVLRISFWIKLTFIVIEVILAIAFAVCTFDKRPNPGAVLEWIIALIFTFWVLSFFIDLLPAMHTKHHTHGTDTTLPNSEMGMQDGRNGRASAMSMGGRESAARPMTYDGDSSGFYDGTAEREHAGVGYSEPVGVNGYANGRSTSKYVTPAQNF